MDLVILDEMLEKYKNSLDKLRDEEKYKWEYAKKHEHEFDNLDNFENKINGLENYNFRPYFLMHSGLKHLTETYNINTFKESLSVLYNEEQNLKDRISEFLKILHKLLINDIYWKNKEMLPDETDASYFLFTNNYKKYLLFYPKKSFNIYANKLNLSDLSDKSNKIDRYIKWQNYCINDLIPQMNKFLNKECTPLDAQNFIWYVGNDNSCASFREELLNIYRDRGFEIDDTPNDYTAIRNKTNIAEIHKMNSKNNKFRVILNYDKLPENLRNNCKRVPDSYRWTLNGECWVNSKDSMEDVIKKIDSTIDNNVSPNINLSKEKHYWVLAAGKSSDQWENFKTNSIMAINWNDWELGDLKQYKDKQGILDKVISKYPEYANINKRNDIHALWQFANDIQIGDVVYIKDGRTKILGRGIVKSDYKYDTTRNMYQHTRDVEWTHIGEWESPYTQPTKTLTDITLFKEDVRNMENLITGTKITNKYTKEDYLKEVYQSDEEYETLKSLLLNKKNIILQGCPGVGKSFSARKLAYSIMGEVDDSRIKFIQFHQNYSYEDFIMGYKPDEDGFKLKEGVFYEFCKKAENDPPNKYFFIIDEINRGNLSKIFGELLLAVENNYRGKPVTLAYTKELFAVPENLYIIGMMNTADRSLAMIDYALRRRFSFYQINPAFDSDGFKNYQKSLSNPKFDRMIETIKELNDAICKDESLGSGFCIGHSYLCNRTAETCTDDWLKQVVNYDILPTLQEYWFDDEDSYITWESKLCGVLNAD